jgi:hypothetical protein
MRVRSLVFADGAVESAAPPLCHAARANIQNGAVSAATKSPAARHSLFVGQVAMRNAIGLLRTRIGAAVRSSGRTF